MDYASLVYEQKEKKTSNRGVVGFSGSVDHRGSSDDITSTVPCDLGQAEPGFFLGKFELACRASKLAGDVKWPARGVRVWSPGKI